jgi:hypothetical protein
MRRNTCLPLFQERTLTRLNRERRRTNMTERKPASEAEFKSMYEGCFEDEDSPIKIFIVAELHRQARDFAYVMHIKPQEWRYVQSEDYLQGCRNPVVVCLGGCQRHLRYSQIMGMAKARGAKFLYVEDWR